MTDLPAFGVPVRMKVDLSPFRQIADSFESMREAAAQETADTMLEIAQFLERETALGTPVDRGFLRSGLTSGVDFAAPHMAAAFVGVQGVASSYALPVEEGSRPHFPPLDALIGWVQRHNLAWTDSRGRPMSVRSIAYLIGRKIARTGGRPVHMARTALEQGEAEINAIVERHFAAFVERFFG